MEGRYPPGLYVALADCTDPSREAEFNRWYEDTFIAGLEELSFIRNTRRYENILSDEPSFRGRPEYLCLSEVYREDMVRALKDIRKFDKQLKADGQDFSARVTMLETLYRRVGPEFRSERTGRPVLGLFLVLTYCLDSTREEEYDAWYNRRHAPETLEWGYHDTAYRYKVVDPNDPLPHQSAPYLSIYETSLDPMVAQNALTGFRKQSEGDPLWVNLMGVYYRGSFRQIYPRS
ncbi:hypothetical protein ACFLV1_00835 [Chloroflexota bacterium]